jgi:hypothetical protein
MSGAFAMQIATPSPSRGIAPQLAAGGIALPLPRASRIFSL